MVQPEYKLVDFASKEFKEIKNIRRSVFCGEQGASANSVKNINDEKAIHIGFFLGETAVGCGSAVDCGNGEFELYNICVLKDYRRFKIGSNILKELKSKAIEQGAKQLVATAPVESLDFFHANSIPHDNVSYEKNGKRYIPLRENLVFENAQWLSFGGETQAVVACKEFNIKEIQQTRIFVSGLGYCHIYVNGKRISDRLLAPAWTNYAGLKTDILAYPVFDKLTHRILYENIDITPFVKKGKNVVTFHIGGGWYSQRECPNEGVKPYGRLALSYKILCGDDEISFSDEDVKYRKSYIQRASVYYGEDQNAIAGDYDLTKKINFSSWENADVAEKPLAVLDEADVIPDKVIRTLKPKVIIKKEKSVIYDIGENISGCPVIVFSKDAKAGDMCSVEYAEELAGERLDFASTGGEQRRQKDTYTYDGKKKEFFVEFTWHAGRYIEVFGNAKIKEYRVVHTDIKKKIDYKSDNETLQWIFDAFVRTQQSNTHGCIPSDCPHRERLGYTGDGQLTADTVMMVFDCEKMYRKWLRDIADSQDIYNGHVQHTAPFYGGGGGPGGWGGAMVFVVYSFYKAFGDIEIVKKYYHNMVNYLKYMEAHSEKGLVVREELLGWCLGDWCAPKDNNLTPAPFINTYFYIRALRQAIELSNEIGKSTKEFKAMLKVAEKAFLENYYDKKTGTFYKSTEACDAFGYDLGFGNKKTLKAIVDKFDALGEFDTGIFGTRVLIKTLCENGYKDLAFKLLTSKKENTYYNMKRNGATTIWEEWDGKDSHSHPMFGSVVEYIIKYL